MIHPTDPRPVWPRVGSPVAGGPVTCALCGCRLESVDRDAPGVWTHFLPLGGRDARGCRVACVDLPHDAAGRALIGIPA
jgi:hypothetical protein